MDSAFSLLLTPPVKATISGEKSRGAWSSTRELSEADIDSMAISMVQVVKERGPFLGVSDFINRRLAVPTTNLLITDPSLCGALQAMIEKSAINQESGLQNSSQGINDVVDSNSSMGGWRSNSISFRHYHVDSHATGQWTTQGIPGYVTQANILQGIGANITARGDTFVIRTYGDSRDSNNQIKAKAWCEAVVQRIPDYIASKSITQPSDSSGNNPLEPVVIRNTTDYTLKKNTELLEVNRKFGRQFKIIGFRWLSKDEV